MIKFLCLLLVIVLSGCVSTVAKLDGYIDTLSNVGFSIVDKREKKDSKTETISYLVTSCDYAIDRIGDEVTSPNRLNLLRSDLEQEISNLLKDSKLIVNKYTIHINTGAYYRGVTFSGTGGLIPSLMEKMGSSCKESETSEGWYDKTEITTPYSPVIVQLNVSFNGREIKLRNVYSPTKEFMNKYDDPVSSTEIFNAIRKAHFELIKELASI